jgi:glycosyltransferase involved in cell wall biosynthesis
MLPALTVLHIAPTPFFADRGCHMRIRGLLTALNRRGVRNVLCTYPLGRDVPGIETRRTARIPGYRRQQAGPSLFKYLADPLLLVLSLRTIWQVRPHLIHGHLHEGALLGTMARWLTGTRVPLLFDVQGSLTGELDGHGYFRLPGLRRLFRGMESAITAIPDHFTCSSPGSEQLLIEEFGVAASRITLVHDGCDLPDRLLAQNAARRELALPMDRPVVVYSGALLKNKGLAELCAVMAEARREALGCYFLVVGYPTDELEAFIRQQQLQNDCRLVGRIPYEELPRYLAAATVALEPKLPGSGEASGKLMNYLGAGLPVVCFDTENNRRFLGDAGYFAAASEASGLADALVRALANPREAARRGREGRKRALEYFSWDVAAERLHGLYGRILENDRQPNQPAFYQTDLSDPTDRSEWTPVQGRAKQDLNRSDHENTRYRRNGFHRQPAGEAASAEWPSGDSPRLPRKRQG